MEDHADILAQLAELKKWHEEHCDGGESRNSTAELNSEDQAKLYQILGISPSFISEIETSQSLAANGSDNSCKAVELNNLSASPKEAGSGSADPINKLKITNDLSESDTQSTAVKRPFLKRGQGLTNRFKMHPDRYKLQNLPKYKFTQANKLNRGKSKTETKEVEKKEEEEAPFRYDKERTRKSCLKSDQLEEMKEQMTKLCTKAFEDDDEVHISVLVPESSDSQDENAKRMLDFSRKSPKVTFHSEVIKIPFENYFHRTEEQDESHDGDSIVSEYLEEDEYVGESTNNHEVDSAVQKFAFSSTPVETFKQKHTNPTSDDRSPRTQLLEKGSLLRQKLKELEEETVKFKQQNSQIQKVKQALELERIELRNERIELEKAFAEQRLKMEMTYEKLKENLKQEQLKLDQRAAMPSKKIKDEMKSLRDRVEELEKEIKSREMKHGASQTRLRCHIRTVEKENKEHMANIESLKKENKRLESENSRLLRQKNNKMLSEINKNIARLGTSNEVPKVEDGPTQSLKQPAVKKTVSSNVDHLKDRKKPTNAAKFIPSKGTDESDVVSSSDEDSEANDLRGDAGLGPSTYFPNGNGIKPKRVSTGTAPESEKENKPVAALNETAGPKREVVNGDGSKDVYYPNGNLKKVSSDGMIIKVYYFNKDIKETNVNEGTVKYYYAETKTWHTSYLDGLEILEFPSGQTEHRFKDGKIEIYFPNGQVRITNPKDNDVLEEWRYPDGTTVVETKNKEKIIKLTNGQTEIHTADHKRREYPDGTVKLVYPNGRTETRYSNGRIRIKDKDGQLVSDSQNMT